VFDKFVEETQELLTNLMSTPIESRSVGGLAASEGASLEVVSVEVPTPVPNSSMFPK